MKISPKRSWVYSHWNANALSEEQISYLEVRFSDEMRNEEFNLLFGKAVITPFLL